MEVSSNKVMEDQDKGFAWSIIWNGSPSSEMDGNIMMNLEGERVEKEKKLERRIGVAL